MARGRAAAAVFRAVRALRLGRSARRVVRLLPSGVRRRLEASEVELRVRSGQEAGRFFAEDELVPSRQLERKYRDALLLLSERHGRESLGDYLEFGVYAGASLACMHRATEELGLTRVRLFGFDSFEGLPPSDADEYEDWKPGDFAYDEQAAREYLSRQGVDWGRVILTKGWFDETLTTELLEKEGIVKASVIMVDSDLYSSARTALEFCAPLIRDDAVIFFDDWWPDVLADKGMGEKRAFDEFLEAHPQFRIEELESYYPKAAKVFLVSNRLADGERPG